MADDRTYVALQRAVDSAELRTGCAGVPLDVVQRSFGVGFGDKYPQSGCASLPQYLTAQPEHFRVDAGRVFVKREWERIREGAVDGGVDAVFQDCFLRAASPDLKAALAGLSFGAAVAQGVDAVRLVLERGLRSVNERDVRRRTPLMSAASLEVARVLRRHGADHSLEDADGWSAASHAARSGRADILGFLQHQGASMQHRTHAGDTPLHLAAELGHLACVKALVCWQPDSGSQQTPSAANKKGESVLHLAAGSGCLQTAALLCDCADARSAPCEYTAACEDGDTPLHRAAAEGSEEVVEELARRGAAAVRCADGRGCLPLHRAVCGGHVGCVEALLRHGSAAVGDALGKTPLHHAAELGRVDIFAALLRADGGGQCVDEADARGYTALHYACGQGHARCVGMLMEAGCDHSKPLQVSLYTPIHVAASQGHVDVLTVMLDTVPELVSATTAHSCMTPLHAACLSNSVGSIRVLLAHGASSDTVTKEGDSPLHLVAIDPTLESMTAVIATDNLKSDTFTLRNLAGKTVSAMLQEAAYNSVSDPASRVDAQEIRRCIDMIDGRAHELSFAEERQGRGVVEADEARETAELGVQQVEEYTEHALKEEMEGYVELRTFPYADLRLPDSPYDENKINIFLREFYLTEAEFLTLFETDKERYKQWPQHRKDTKKKELCLLDECLMS